MSNMKEIREKVKHLKVLLVDDETEVLSVTLLFLHKFFKIVDTAKDGEEALEKFKKKANYDIVISDIKMPKLTGWELAKALKEIDKKIFIAAMTGSPEDKDENIAYLDILFEKPVNINNMVLIMEMLIKEKEL